MNAGCSIETSRVAPAPITELSLQDMIDNLPIYHRARCEWELHKRLQKEAEGVLRYMARWDDDIDITVFRGMCELTDALMNLNA